MLRLICILSVGLLGWGTVAWVRGESRLSELREQLCFVPGAVLIELSTGEGCQMGTFSPPNDIVTLIERSGYSFVSSAAFCDKQIGYGAGQRAINYGISVQVPEGGEVAAGQTLVNSQPDLISRFYLAPTLGMSGDFAMQFCDGRRKSAGYYIAWPVTDAIFGGELGGNWPRFKSEQLEGTDFLALLGNSSS